MGLGLNLANADVKGFEAFPSGTYDAIVFDVTNVHIKGEDGTLPKGTPGLNVQFKISGGEYDNRRVFNNYWIAPEKIGGKKYDKKAMMDGMLVRFFLAIGFSEDEVMSGDFDPDIEDLKGRECRVVVGQKEYNGETQNIVKGVKPVGDDSGSSGSGLI